MTNAPYVASLYTARLAGDEDESGWRHFCAPSPEEAVDRFLRGRSHPHGGPVAVEVRCESWDALGWVRFDATPVATVRWVSRRATPN